MTLPCHLPPNTLELLAPAKDKIQGMEAIRHGADAVYIGAPAFGARAAVPVSTDDIRDLVEYAHLYQARVYVALNTILRDDEIPIAVEIAHQMYDIGVDALIVQDLGLLTQDLPPIALHASTQMDNVSAERVAFWASQGIEQIVVARELSPAQISKIHALTPDVRLEAFVHGALCASYSGRCYAAAAFHGRSANRGSCSQVCRLPYDLLDGSGRVLIHNKHLLSVKDLNRSQVLGQFIEAGVRSFKIEGRLKDISYVKNVTLSYHKLLNKYIQEHPGYARTSIGRVEASFTPDLSKVFNRGYTTFVHRGRGKDDLQAFATPKSIGPVVGRVTSVSGVRVTLQLMSDIELSNGDGFTFITVDGGTLGFRANTVNGNIITLSRSVPELKRGMTIHRSNDQKFERLMQSQTAHRRIQVNWSLSYSDPLLQLSASIPDAQINASIEKGIQLELSQKGNPVSSVHSVLTKLGSTPFYSESSHISVDDNTSTLFIPRSSLTQMRQEVTNALEKSLRSRALETRRTRNTTCLTNPQPYWTSEVNYTANLLNVHAKQFLRGRGVTVHQMAYEHTPRRDEPIMYTKHCIRYSLQQCPYLQDYKGVLCEPWSLRSTLPNDTNPVRMRIEFDCPNCQMKLIEST